MAEICPETYTMTDRSKRKRTAEYFCGPLFIRIRENLLNPWERS